RRKDQGTTAQTRWLTLCHDRLCRGRDYTEFSLNRYDGNPSNPARAFGASLSEQLGDVSSNPSTASPDVEFSIRNFSSLGANGVNGGRFSVNAKIGSAEDDGIGEDYLAAQAVAVKLK
ncbi:hypothetical protein KAH55_13070, partial [bacterium]|nr:hypothetical protein [bacterium]